VKIEVSFPAAATEGEFKCSIDTQGEGAQQETELVVVLPQSNGKPNHYRLLVVGSIEREETSKLLQAVARQLLH
jgi:hypothetical protein